MLLVVLVVIAATGVGVLCEHRTGWGVRAARGCLAAILYVLAPFVAYVSFAHLHLSVAGGVGLAIAYVGLASAAILTWSVGRRVGAPRPQLGALVVCVLVANTGYLGYPMTVALLGEHALSHAVVYDQVISSPMTFTVGFAVGAAFGETDRTPARRQLRRFVTRNPPLMGAIAGLLVPTSWAPHVLVSAAHVVVDALLVFGFFAVGAFLSSERRESRAPLIELPSREVLIALAGRFCVNPALLGLVSLAGVGIPGAYLLQALMPSGINCLLIGYAFDLDQRLIATVIVWGTLLVLVVGTLSYLV